MFFTRPVRAYWCGEVADWMAGNRIRAAGCGRAEWTSLRPPRSPSRRSSLICPSHTPGRLFVRAPLSLCAFDFNLMPCQLDAARRATAGNSINNRTDVKKCALSSEKRARRRRSGASFAPPFSPDVDRHFEIWCTVGNRRRDIKVAGVHC